MTSIVIKKITLSEFAGPSFWGNFNLFLTLNLTDQQLLKLTDFYSALEFYRLKITNQLSFVDGHGHKFISHPESLTAYTYYGVIDTSIIDKVIESGPEYQEFVEKRNDFFNELGWTLYESKIIEIDSNFDEATQDYTNLPNTISEIEKLYNSASLLDTVLGR